MEGMMYERPKNVGYSRCCEIFYCILASLSIVPLGICMCLFMAVFYLEISEFHLQTWQELTIWLALIASLLWGIVLQLCGALNSCRGLSQDSIVMYIVSYIVEIALHVASMMIADGVLQNDYDNIIRSLAYFLLIFLGLSGVLLVLCLALYCIMVFLTSERQYDLLSLTAYPPDCTH